MSLDELERLAVATVGACATNTEFELAHSLLELLPVVRAAEQVIQAKIDGYATPGLYNLRLAIDAYRAGRTK